MLALTGVRFTLICEAGPSFSGFACGEIGSDSDRFPLVDWPSFTALSIAREIIDVLRIDDCTGKKRQREVSEKALILVLPILLYRTNLSLLNYGQKETLIDLEKEIEKAGDQEGCQKESRQEKDR
ncbi:hypothetical protein [Rhodopirellula sallentina]|uniref:hypothetical protein n=1 Tax=Rhodopirellula sallentina TaxID=1263869 RepID=UPI001360B69A|nr:hypothetical protein [Rhodopirellula sallentina]